MRSTSDRGSFTTNPSGARIVPSVTPSSSTRASTFALIRTSVGSDSVGLSFAVTASAGPNRRNGTLEIPEGFGLVMAPFDGAPPVNVPARFRYRVGDGRATFGVVLEQAAKIQRDAFDAEVERIRVHAPFVVMVGTPDTTA